MNPDTLHPDYPIVEGLYQMNPAWAIQLPEKMNRRFEENNLVLWRPGLTAWIAIWNNPHKQTAAERLETLKSRVSPEAFDIVTEQRDATLSLIYRLREAHGAETVEALHSYTYDTTGHVQLAIYVDDPIDLPTAQSIARAVIPTTPAKPSEAPAGHK